MWLVEDQKRNVIWPNYSNTLQIFSALGFWLNLHYQLILFSLTQCTISLFPQPWISYWSKTINLKVVTSFVLSYFLAIPKLKILKWSIYQAEKSFAWNGVQKLIQIFCSWRQLFHIMNDTFLKNSNWIKLSILKSLETIILWFF